MNTKKDAQFSFGECCCAEMLAQMMPQSEGKQGAGDACVEMMAQFDGAQRGGQCIEMMSQIMSAFCGGEEVSD